MANKSNTTVHGRPRYRIRYRVPGEYRIDKNGFRQPVYRNFYGESKKAAEAKRDSWIEEHKHDSEPTFQEVMQFFLTSILPADTTLKASSKRLYTRSWQANFSSQKFLYRKVSMVDTATLQAAIDELPCSVSTKKNIIKLLRRFYRYIGIEYQLPDRSQFLSAGRLQGAEPKPLVVWREQESKQLLSELQGHRLYLLVWLALNTGCRISELLALRYSDFKDGVISIDRQVIITEKVDENGNQSLVFDVGAPKSRDSIRKIPYTDTTAAKLADHKRWHEDEMRDRGYKTQYVFTTNTGRFVDRRNVVHALQSACRRAGVEYRKFHAFRATFASRLAATGTPPQVLKELLGHSDIAVTFRYYVSVPDEQKKAAIDSLCGDELATK